jgi:hypothetical protein
MSQIAAAPRISPIRIMLRIASLIFIIFGVAYLLFAINAFVKVIPGITLDAKATPVETFFVLLFSGALYLVPGIMGFIKTGSTIYAGGFFTICGAAIGMFSLFYLFYFLLAAGSTPKHSSTFLIGGAVEFVMALMCLLFVIGGALKGKDGED